MIIARFSVSSNLIVGFSVNGHSGSAEAGKDVICSAVSSPSYMTVNTLTEVLKLNPEIVEKDGFLSVSLNSSDAETAKDILNGFELHLIELSKLYPNYIKVERGAK